VQLDQLVLAEFGELPDNLAQWVTPVVGEQLVIGDNKVKKETLVTQAQLAQLELLDRLVQLAQLARLVLEEDWGLLAVKEKKDLTDLLPLLGQLVYKEYKAFRAIQVQLASVLLVPLDPKVI
jgi:hypothetical protein